MKYSKLIVTTLAVFALAACTVPAGPEGANGYNGQKGDTGYGGAPGNTGATGEQERQATRDTPVRQAIPEPLATQAQGETRVREERLPPMGLW